MLPYLRQTAPGLYTILRVVPRSIEPQRTSRTACDQSECAAVSSPEVPQSLRPEHIIKINELAYPSSHRVRGNGISSTIRFGNYGHKVHADNGIFNDNIVGGSQLLGEEEKCQS